MNDELDSTTKVLHRHDSVNHSKPSPKFLRALPLHMFRDHSASKSWSENVASDLMFETHNREHGLDYTGRELS